MKLGKMAAAVCAASALILASSAPVAFADHGGGRNKGTLRKAAPRDLKIGTAAAGGGHHLNQDYEGLEPGQSPFLYDQKYRRYLRSEFNSLSPENQAKWEFIHPQQGVYNFGEMDAIARFAKRNGQAVRGHTLLWHSQNPEWLEKGNFTDRQLRRILRDHIRTVVGRYKGKIYQWDVANEIIKDDGTGLRVGPTSEGGNLWITRLGPGIIADAFRWAHQADPQAKLFLNDYGVESLDRKSNAYYTLVQDLLKQGVPIDGFAVQAHLSTRFDFPATLQQNLQRFDDLGLETAITELDVRMDVPVGQQPTWAQLERQATDYRRALEACLGVENCNSFTIWGFTDRYSWVPVFFTGQGFANVFTANYVRKPAYYALLDTLNDTRLGATQPFVLGGAANPVPTDVTTAQGTGNVSALTFDDGPNPGETQKLLDFLNANNIKATFCVIGQNITAPGGAAILKRIVNEGHVLCNHTTSYADMGSWTPEQVEADLRANLKIIRDALGNPKQKVPYFRAPNGSWGQTRGVAVALGMQPLGVINTINDWATQDRATLEANLRAAMKPGELVLAHDGGGDRNNTVAAVQTVVRERRAAGWKFTLPTGGARP
ncbi:MAG TPA: endo-1,4-beta-xylanase [Actinomycetales bacterium]|nr:endo-1,4-beta-xylanase [Actinomycetales bacterium]